MIDHHIDAPFLGVLLFLEDRAIHRLTHPEHEPFAGMDHRTIARDEPGVSSSPFRV
jgi:hypothetical protein